jgi:DNA-binding MarR family transcriptional regulator
MEKTNNIIVQKLRTQLTDSYSVAEKYYSLLSAVNNLGLTAREIQLIAFTAIKGNISYANIRSEFCDKYKSSPPTINNMISKLKRIGVFIKDGTKVKVNPIIVLNFDKDITLQINVTHG